MNRDMRDDDDALLRELLDTDNVDTVVLKFVTQRRGNESSQHLDASAAFPITFTDPWAGSSRHTSINRRRGLMAPSAEPSAVDEGVQTTSVAENLPAPKEYHLRPPTPEHFPAARPSSASGDAEDYSHSYSYSGSSSSSTPPRPPRQPTPAVQRPALQKRFFPTDAAVVKTKGSTIKRKPPPKRGQRRHTIDLQPTVRSTEEFRSMLLRPTFEPEAGTPGILLSDQTATFPTPPAAPPPAKAKAKCFC